MIKGVLFDMDGVLFDSERVGEVIFQSFCEAKGFNDVHAIFLSMLGSNYEQDRRICQKNFGDDFPYDEVMHLLNDQRAELAAKGKIPLKDGVMDCLRFLRERKIAAAIVSGTNRDLIMTYLDTVPGLREFFHAIIPGDIGLPSKPDPASYLKAAECLGLKPEECIGVEDSLNGVKALHAAGVYSVCIPDLNPWCEEYYPYVNVCCDSMLQLPAFIDRMNRGGKLRA